MRRQLIFTYTLLILITLAGVALFARSNAATQIHQYIGRGGALNAEDLVGALESYYAANGWEGVETVMTPDGPGEGRRPGGQGGRNLRVADADGYLVYTPSGELPAEPLSSAELTQAIRLLSEGETIGYLLSAQDTVLPGIEFEENVIDLLDLALLRAAMLGGATAVIMAILLAAALIRPLRNVTQAASELARGKLDLRVTEAGPPEIKALAHSFNHMASSLQRLENNRRAMTADIAHELRTPLSVQRVNLEAMQDGIYPLDQANLEIVAAQNRLLTRLVEDLRTLSLVDSGELDLELAKVDLPAFLTRFHRQALADARDHGILLELQLPQESLSAHLDPLRTSQILYNLLHNALRYAPEGSTITLKLTAEKEAALIAIRDHGQGIPEDALEHLFERFYQADHLGQHSKEGTGLGLAIARRLAELQGGTLSGENAPGGGAVFCLRFPASDGTILHSKPGDL